MSTTYYVDSVNGSDGNSGLGAGSPFRSLDRLEGVALQPGDQVLFARGSVFSDQLDVRFSGTADAPIVFGAYGSGAPPTVQRAEQGDLRRQYARHRGAGHLDRKYRRFGRLCDPCGELDDRARGHREHRPLHQGRRHLLARRQRAHRQGQRVRRRAWRRHLYQRVNEASITGNVFLRLEGPNADGIQATDTTNLSIASNTIDMASSPNTTKGGIVVNRGGTALIADNDITGGSFGIGATSQNVTIRDNNISGQTRYPWSAAILVGEGVGRRELRDRAEHDPRQHFRRRAHLAGRSSPLRQNIDIAGNSFDRLSGAALKIDRPSTGAFHDNTVRSSAATR